MAQLKEAASSWQGMHGGWSGGHLVTASGSRERRPHSHFAFSLFSHSSLVGGGTHIHGGSTTLGQTFLDWFIFMHVPKGVFLW